MPEYMANMHAPGRLRLSSLITGEHTCTRMLEAPECRSRRRGHKHLPLPGGSLELLTRGPEQDLVHVHLLRLAHGEGDGPRK